MRSNRLFDFENVFESLCAERIIIGQSDALIEVSKKFVNERAKAKRPYSSELTELDKKDDTANNNNF